jgi:Transposase DNA-binding/Transposase DDE domain
MKVPDIEAEFAGAELGDARRARRLGRIAARIAEGPGRSVPEATETDAELEGCYRFLNNEQVSAEAVLAPHQRRTVERAAAHAEVLVVHDTTSFRFCDDDSREGLGPLLSKNGARGFYAHVAMAVALGDVRDPLGVLAVHDYVRSTQRASSKQTKRITDPGNEYHRFAHLVDQSERQLCGRSQAIHVIDREADVYELFARMVACKQRFVIRLSDDRATPERIEGTRTHIKLSDVVRNLEGMTEREVPLSPRKSSRAPATRRIHPTRDGRIAKLSFRATAVELRRPENLATQLPKSLALHLVHVIELEPPEGNPPVEWTLLTTESIDTIEGVLRIVDIYRARWTIEELFKALKTGCAFEQRQFRSYDALRRLLAIMLPVAWRLLRIRTAARIEPDRPGSDLLTAVQLKVLAATSKRFALPASPSAAQILLAIAGLGGHLKRNGQPGWITLGRGFDTLLAYEVGYRAALQAEM